MWLVDVRQVRCTDAYSLVESLGASASIKHKMKGWRRCNRNDALNEGIRSVTGTRWIWGVSPFSTLCVM